MKILTGNSEIPSSNLIWNALRVAGAIIDVASTNQSQGELTELEWAFKQASCLLALFVHMLHGDYL